MLSTLLASILASATLPPGTCTLIADSAGKVVFERGSGCAERTTPASTFKIPLALMGADAGWILGAHLPKLPYQERYQASLPAHRRATDPALWQTESVVWYSQELTAALGMERFQSYVERFAYGNHDVSGNPGKSDGLSRSWLSSSLAISPAEQINFLARVRGRKLGVSPRAHEILDSIMPRFAGPSGWTVAGKTGSSNADSAAQESPVGWFVGWIERDGRAPYLFVRREIGQVPRGSFGGGAARKSFLDSLGGWLPAFDGTKPAPQRIHDPHGRGPRQPVDVLPL
ncbi:MAG TPA: penicillin-binding transpeptidase domain-containing protein [Fibrobacteria bacterium]|nr:penicillin-binding transpeptidase domain-containing protein [Fibrobacteria bacterium]